MGWTILIQFPAGGGIFLGHQASDPMGNRILSLGVKGLEHEGYN
jgi:hypothetical protein